MCIMRFFGARPKPARSPASQAFLPGLGVLLLFLAACGSGDQPESQAAAAAAQPEGTAAAGGTRFDQCSLLTPEEVAAALGTPLGPPEPFADDRHPACIYTSGAEARWVLHIATTRFASPTAVRNYRALEQEYREDAERHGIEVGTWEYLDGLGTAAVWRGDEGQLAAAVPGYEVVLTNYATSIQSNFDKQRARVLMEKALARLP